MVTARCKERMCAAGYFVYYGTPLLIKVCGCIGLKILRYCTLALADV